jgi:hypothetical protein
MLSASSDQKVESAAGVVESNSSRTAAMFVSVGPLNRANRAVGDRRIPIGRPISRTVNRREPSSEAQSGTDSVEFGGIHES